jgi:hypothetical protein
MSDKYVRILCNKIQQQNLKNLNRSTPAQKTASSSAACRTA